MEISVYRSDRKPDTYLLVRVEEGLSRVPETLLKTFGTPSHSFDFTLDDGKQLQRVEPDVLKAQLTESGFYLQLPPPETV